MQDRLVSELRLAGATTIDQANNVLWDFLPRFNRQFGVPDHVAKCNGDMVGGVYPRVCGGTVFLYRSGSLTLGLSPACAGEPWPRHGELLA